MNIFNCFLTNLDLNFIRFPMGLQGCKCKWKYDMRRLPRNAHEYIIIISLNQIYSAVYVFFICANKNCCLHYKNNLRQLHEHVSIFVCLLDNKKCEVHNTKEICLT